MGAINEDHCCDAVLRILSKREDSAPIILSRDTAQSRGIEVRCEIAGTKYAIEHTTIDPYPDRRQDDQHFLKVLQELEDSLSHKGLLRSDCWYQLYVDIHAFRGVKQREIASIRETLRSWVLSQTHALNPPPGKHTLEIFGVPPTCPVRVLLQCTSWPELGGKFSIGRLAPPNLSDLRQARLREAIQKKGPKLHAEHNANSVTVLILEDSDIALSNHIEIGRALHTEMEACAFHIDEIYLVETKLPDSWLIHLLKKGAKTWPTRSESPSRWKTDPHDLSTLSFEAC